MNLSPQEKGVKRMYKGWYARTYNPLMAILKLLLWRVYQHVDERFKFGSETDKVLDLGCGTGEILGRLKRAGMFESYLGLDQSEDMLAVAQQIYGEGEHITFQRDSIRNFQTVELFDRIYAFWVLSHLSTGHGAIVKNYRDNLTEDGRMVILTFVKQEGLLARIVGWVFETLFSAKPLSQKVIHSFGEPLHKQPFWFGIVQYLEFN